MEVVAYGGRDLFLLQQFKQAQAGVVHVVAAHGSGRKAVRDDVRADGFNQYADLRKGFQLFTTETVAVEADTTREQSKLVFFVRRGAGIEQRDLFRHWLDVHMPNVAQGMRSTPGTGRYTVSLADLGRDGPYDGVAELYLDKPDAVLADVQGIQADGFQEMTESGMLALRGHEIRAV